MSWTRRSELPGPWQAVPGTQAPVAAGAVQLMRCEMKSFQELFWKCNAFNFKKLKLSLSPSPQWPQAALRLGGDGRQVPKADQGRSSVVFGL